MTTTDSCTDTGAKAASDRPLGDDRPIRVLLVARQGEGECQAREAIDQVDARLIDVVDWVDAAKRLGDHALFDILVVEAEGVSDDRLEAVLPRIDTLARASDAGVMIALGDSQIDIVSAHLFGPRVQLLCGPTLTERVAALALAVGPARQLRDRVHEGERERLRRLNEEVARIAQTLVRLTAHEDLLPSAERSGLAGDRRGSYRSGPAQPSRPIDPQVIRDAIRARRLRDQFFSPALLEDPGWDMLLDLFAAELEERRVSVSSLCIAAAVAPTTALRWIGKMSDAGLFERRPDPFDRRRAFMSLTDAARAGMQRYCDAVRHAGLAIA